jgi:hypothetical protein
VNLDNNLKIVTHYLKVMEQLIIYPSIILKG